MARGKRANTVCGAAANPPNTGKCKRHCDGGHKRKRKAAVAMGAAELAEIGTGNYGSDDEGIGGGVDDLVTKGAYADFSTSERIRLETANRIPEKNYRQGYLDAFELKKKAKVCYQSR